MNDQERLSYLKERYEEEKDIARYAGITLTENELKWIIERIQYLERKNNEYQLALESINNFIKGAIFEVEREE